MYLPPPHPFRQPPWRPPRPGRSSGPHWHKRRRRWTEWAWAAPRKSGFENVERALDHGARRIDDVEVGRIGTLGIAHVGHLDQRIDVRVAHVAVGICRRIAGLALDLEIGRIGPDRPELHHP